MAWRERAISVSGGGDWRNRAIPVQVDQDPTAIEAFAGGAGQGLTFGFSDELMAAIKSPFSPKDYVTLREEERANLRRQSELHPIASAAGEITGGVLPALGASLLSEGAAAPVAGARLAPAAATLGKALFSPTTLKGVAATSGLYGLGKTEADLTKGEFGKAATDVGQSAALGYGVGKFAVPALAKGVQAVQGAVRGGLEKLGVEGATTALSTAFGPSRTAIKARLTRPAAIQQATPFDELAHELAATANKMDDEITKLSDAAFDALGDVPVLEFNKPLSYLKGLQDDLGASGVSFGGANKEAQNVLQKYIDDFKELADKSYGGKKVDYVFSRDLKKILKAIDNDTDWDAQVPEVANRALKDFRHYVDTILKDEFPDYKAVMEPLAERVGLSQNIRKSFGIRKHTGEGYLPSDTTAGKIKQILDQKKVASRGALEELQALTGKDIIGEAENSRLAEEFTRSQIRGSRRAVMYGGAGAGIGAALGGPLGGVVGGGLGTIVGGTVDVKGGEYAAKTIDWIVRNKPEKLLDMMTMNPSIFGKYRPVIENSLRRGVSSFASTHFILQQNDPEYRKMMNEMSNEKEPAGGSQNIAPR